MRRILALSMAVLIALIPVQVSAAVASLSGLNIQGQEGISRVLAETDSLNVEVTSSMDVGAQQVRLLYSGRERAFDSCSGGVCTYSSELMDWRAGRHSLQVVLYDQYFIELHRLSDAFFVDAAGPEILFSVSREGNSVTVSYSLKDTACEGCGSYASGLAKAELKHGANVLATAELNGTSATGTLQADNLDEGSTELCLHAYDLFGNSNSRCETVFIDTTAPSISGFSLTAAGEPVTHSGALPFNAVASVNVTEENELASVLGDLSALNAVAPELYRWVAARCGKQGAAHVCSWDVKVDGVDGAAAIRINATDKAGNTASITETVNIALDLGKPVVLSIDSQGTDAEHKYLRLKNNTLIMEIDEPESGMGTADAYLELYSLNSNLANEKAHRCEKDGTWRCYWENMDVAGKQDGATLTARVVSVRDMVGNAWDEVLI